MIDDLLRSSVDPQSIRVEREVAHPVGRFI